LTKDKFREEGHACTLYRLQKHKEGATEVRRGEKKVSIVAREIQE